MPNAREIEFLDISYTNCWMIYLMPFDASERTDYERVNDLQQKCMKERIFGMGWDIPCFDYGTLMTKDNASLYAERYRTTYEKDGGSVSKDAIDGYQSIKKGDYVITRLKNGHYLVGRVSSDGAMYIYKENDPIYGMFSWGGKVEKWVEYTNDQEIPSEIVGRFSQRLHATIQRISPYRQRLLVISMYEKKEKNPRFNVPRLHIGINNYVRSLNYMELEDLVALYIADKHAEEGYKLLPSSCKISQQNYEFAFFANGRKPITCQVKNQSEIAVDHYVGETSYERIYIFSGKWSEEQVEDKKREYKKSDNIYIISPAELYSTLRKERFLNNDFYDFDGDVISPYDLNLTGYEERKKPKGESTYSIDEEFICFVNKDGLFYSAEFGALIHSWDVFKDTSYNKDCINKILSDINRPTVKE